MTINSKKMKNYFEHLSSNKKFLSKIDSVRKKREEYDKKNTGEGVVVFYNTEEYWSFIEKICHDFGLPFPLWKVYIHRVIYYNQWFFDEEYNNERMEMCLSSSWEEMKILSSEIFNENDIKELQRDFPVFIAINTYATQQDVLDFVRINFKGNILPQLNKTKISKIRINKIRKTGQIKKERDEFILKPEHENLSGKELAILVNKTFKDKEGYNRVDYTLINKIRNKGKRRK